MAKKGDTEKEKVGVYWTGFFLFFFAAMIGCFELSIGYLLSCEGSGNDLRLLIMISVNAITCVLLWVGIMRFILRKNCGYELTTVALAILLVGSLLMLKFIPGEHANIRLASKLMPVQILVTYALMLAYRGQVVRKSK